MNLQTVLGKPLTPPYDVVLAHEHLNIDIRCWADTEHPLFERLADQKVDQATLAEVRKNPFACLDNLVLDEEHVMLRELRDLVGTKTLLIDVTPDHLGGDVDRLARLSRLSGVDVIRGCGAYIERSWPETFQSYDEQQFAERILSQFKAPNPPAVIGEIGTSAPMTAAERRSLAGAALAQAVLDVPLYVHLHPWEPDAPAALDVVEAHGGDLARTVLCHMDVTAPPAIDRIEDLLRRGCFVAFDIWGDEDVYGDVAMPRDVDRARATADLVSRGWGARLLHSHDICTKSQLRNFEGPGFAHVPANVPSLLRQAGLTDDEIARQLAINALSLLGLDEGHPVEAGGIRR